MSNTCLRRRRPREAPPAPAATFCTDNTGGGAVATHRQKPGMQAKAHCAAWTKQPGREESLTSALPPILRRETEAWGSNACRAQGLERCPLERPGLHTRSTVSRPQFFRLSHWDNGNLQGSEYTKSAFPVICSSCATLNQSSTSLGCLCVEFRIQSHLMPWYGLGGGSGVKACSRL